ncbi:Progestin and adipoQ receptor family member 4 [Daphnia magna]|uniref:Progestin and adipoQ receptor family member 4 n=1 Tax=Daphnia magna TaxID=35525 RepID=A0A0P5SV29_9CRUS|nr:Progestin and adipoQ receptor family member 4 [Daphnia magna]
MSSMNSSNGCVHQHEPADRNGVDTNDADGHDKKATGMRLLKWTQQPDHLKFNPYIHDGYRPLASLAGCIKSLAYFHNETVNILTHGLPVLYIILWSPTLMPYDEIKVPILPYIHLVAVLSPWVGSAIYHTFMNHHHGYSIYRRLLQLDMLGIWVTQSFGALTGVRAATYCFPSCTGIVIVVIYCLSCLWGLYKAVTAGSSGNPWDRRLCFCLPVLIRLTLVILRTMNYASGHPSSIAHVWLQDTISILGGFIGAMRIPERWFPGRFDYFFNSHHIMHVLVLVAVVQMHYASKLDLIWLSHPQCPDSPLETLVVISTPDPAEL